MFWIIIAVAVVLYLAIFIPAINWELKHSEQWERDEAARIEANRTANTRIN